MPATQWLRCIICMPVLVARWLLCVTLPRWVLAILFAFEVAASEVRDHQSHLDEPVTQQQAFGAGLASIQGIAYRGTLQAMQRPQAVAAASKPPAWSEEHDSSRTGLQHEFGGRPATNVPCQVHETERHLYGYECWGPPVGVAKMASEARRSS
mmetsp:Transcript_45/g.147  ORF Transcript_45/g.147 Transcript_45/m.147 type:complete len:153 (-) Transcript_45:364-822(-)